MGFEAGFNGKIWSIGFDKRFCFTDKDIEQKIQYVNKHAEVIAGIDCTFFPVRLLFPGRGRDKL